MLTEDIALARHWAQFYAARGFNVLPCRPDAKRPLVRFAQWWEEPVPTGLIDRFETPSLQVMTGRRWRLLVIDLDGPAARDWFLDRGSVPRTWSVHSGGDGLHLWFQLPPPDRLPSPLPKSILWKGDGEHSAVERLCDRSLVMAPPSLHPTTGTRYRFSSRRESPAQLPMPALCPAWVLALPALVPPRPDPLPIPFRPDRKIVVPTGVHYRASDVLDAIPDKLSLASTWGLRIASRRPNHAGWCSCHALDREDRTPSASISVETGRYWEPGAPTISFFKLAVRLGVYVDWRDAVADLGSSHRVQEMTP